MCFLQQSCQQQTFPQHCPTTPCLPVPGWLCPRGCRCSNTAWARTTSAVEESALQSFSEEPGPQGLFLVLFLLLFLGALAGNTLIVTAISLHPGLHTPMYFFLTSLAVLAIVCTSTVLPKLLEDLAVKGGTTAYRGCMTQLSSLTRFLGAELQLLTVMAYGRCGAICRPLHYSSRMGRPVCVPRAGSVRAGSAASASVRTGLTTRLTCCGPGQIRHVLCEVPTLLLLSCSPATRNDVMTVAADVCLAVVSGLLTAAPCGCLIARILRTCSAAGERRAFSAGSSPLRVLPLYSSTVTHTHILPGSGSSLENGNVVSMLYTAVSPTLNPLICSLRNKDVKVALRKVFS